jgi:hypothetical protein
MKDQVNTHQFKFSLPQFPNQSISENGTQCELKMDGHDMKGVTGGHLRFGANGFTNVVIEFEASCLAEFDAHLIAHMDANDTLEFQMAQIYRDARNEVENELDGEGLEYSHFGQAKLVQRIIEMTAERLKY